MFTAHYDRSVKRRESSLGGSKRTDNYFSIPSNSQQRDDADAVIVNEQMEDFEGIDGVSLDK